MGGIAKVMCSPFASGSEARRDVVARLAPRRRLDIGPTLEGIKAEAMLLKARAHSASRIIIIVANKSPPLLCERAETRQLIKNWTKALVTAAVLA